MIGMNSRTLAFLAFLFTVSCAGIKPTPPNPGPVVPCSTAPSPDLPFSALDTRQAGLFERYPGVQPSAPNFWANSLDQSQRVEFAGGTRVVIKVETDHGWQAIGAVTGIHGKEPNTSSAEQFNADVVWSKDAASHFKKLPNWSEHLALLHPGQYGYQENRDDNPFLGMVVLFDEHPADRNKVAGQFHIGFRSFFGHYEAENGDIGDKDNFPLYKRWYGPIACFEP